MKTFLDKIKSEIGDELFVSPTYLVKIGVFGSYPSCFRAIKDRQIAHIRQRSSIRIPVEAVFEYLEKNFHAAEEITKSCK